MRLLSPSDLSAILPCLGRIWVFPKPPAYIAFLQKVILLQSRHVPDRSLFRNFSFVIYEARSWRLLVLGTVLTLPRSRGSPASPARPVPPFDVLRPFLEFFLNSRITQVSVFLVRMPDVITPFFIVSFTLLRSFLFCCPFRYAF